ncbi:unnamed protein product, partial [Meganyctiphanes norvegica]
ELSLDGFRPFILSWCSGEVVVTKQGGAEYKRISASDMGNVDLNLLTHVMINTVQSTGNNAFIKVNHLVDPWYPHGSQSNAGTFDYAIMHKLPNAPTSSFTLTFKCKASRDCDLHFFTSTDLTDNY